MQAGEQRAPAVLCGGVAAEQHGASAAVRLAQDAAHGLRGGKLAAAQIKVKDDGAVARVLRGAQGLVRSVFQHDETRFVVARGPERAVCALDRADRA